MKFEVLTDLDTTRYVTEYVSTETLGEDHYSPDKKFLHPISDCTH